MRRPKYISPAVITMLGVICLASTTGIPTALAAESASEHDHSHGATTPAPKPETAAVTNMMQQMQAMHAKVMAATTPKEREAAMQAQMSLMKSSMTMMQSMHGDSAQRMDMMQMMMQMMMDRMSTPSPGTQNPSTPGK
jgi:hypothetical protein